MISGGTPTTVPAIIRASGGLSRVRAYSPEATRAAAAPSTIAELLPPV